MLTKYSKSWALLVSLFILSNLQAEEGAYKQFMQDRQEVKHDKELLKKVQDGQIKHRDITSQAKIAVSNYIHTKDVINSLLGDDRYKHCMMVKATIGNQKYILDYIKERAKNGEITKSDKEYLLKINAVSTKLQKTQQECKKTYGEKL